MPSARVGRGRRVVTAKRAFTAWAMVVFAFLYLPIAVMVLFAFNKPSPAALAGFTGSNVCDLPPTQVGNVTVWNGFLLPLVLTQSPEQRTMPLAVWSFQGQFQVNVPAVLASVVLSTVPMVVLYALGRRQLVSGLSEGFSK